MQYNISISNLNEQCLRSFLAIETVVRIANFNCAVTHKLIAEILNLDWQW